MGKMLDALLGKTFKPNKLKALISLSISRVAVLKHQRQIRSSQARADVLQLLNLGHHERALIRVEQVIKEQDMMDVFVMIDGYLNVLIERIRLIEQEKECPDELKDATSGLIFAASRCGEFPELQEIRAVFISRFGKEFVARATELRNNCGVNPVLIQKMSTRKPSLESRINVLKEIASENGIDLKLDDPVIIAAEKELDKQMQNQPLENQPVNEIFLADGIDNGGSLTDSMNMRRKYKDVGQAAEEAFKSAAQAAAAARAAVELSRSGSGGTSGHFSNDYSHLREEKGFVGDAKSDDPLNKRGGNSGPADNLPSEKEKEKDHPLERRFDSGKKSVNHNEVQQAEDIKLSGSNLSRDQEEEEIKRTWKRPISVRTKR